MQVDRPPKGFPSSSTQKTTKGSASSSDEKSPKGDRETVEHRAKSGHGTLPEAQGSSRNARKTSAREPRVRNDDSKPVQHHSSEKSGDDHEESSKDDRENAQGTAKSGQNTVAKGQGSSRGPSKATVREHRSIRNSESESAHSQSSEKSSDSDHEPGEHHSILEKPADIRSRRTSGSRNSQDDGHEPRPALISGDEEKDDERDH
ncbi:transcriptional regulator ATRX homolog [Dermacentor silvarum]|uniref:transcriptional regulator ATRX homolog n=1 Tax=Dermacentor silvarum TaxID=543639 RepID=UPI001898FEBE|nr:transcriptional regulator ATRX homolog [Dermacentor silvarum]